MGALTAFKGPNTMDAVAQLYRHADQQPRLLAGMMFTSLKWEHTADACSAAQWRCRERHTVQKL